MTKLLKNRLVAPGMTRYLVDSKMPGLDANYAYIARLAGIEQNSGD